MILTDEDVARAARAVAIGLLVHTVLRPLLKWGFYLALIVAALLLL